MRRRVVALAVAALVSVPLTAVADESLEELLESSGAGEFHGVGVVMCTWGRDSAAATYQVERSRGMSMVHGPDRDLMLSGSLVAMGSGAEWYALEVAEWSSWALSDRYTLGEPRAVTRLGRPATEVVIFEEGRPRARLVIDDESTIPLVTEILDGEGRVFRLASLVEFAVGPGAEHREMPDEYRRRTVMESVPATSRLPADTTGYRLVDAYEAPGGSQSYYSDGLFSFSVFEAGRGQTPAEFEQATRFGVDGKVYRRVVTPTNVWVHWNSRDHSYVLVGDLPPDHLIAVLQTLPEPGDPAFFVRLWRRLFG
ncbi:MAG TPA: hypothetical protein VK960_02140 [Acidimicrobiia bacterium]|nr:hypothetical protein [Acidimicrobiia bacterium]